MANNLSEDIRKMKFALSSWQKARLQEMDSERGIQCLLTMWFTDDTEMPKGSYCNSTWDNHYCWPSTPAGTIIKRNCSEVLQENHPQYASFLKGSAFRICQENGTWLKGNWTNYSECADSYDEYVEQSIMQAEENELKEKVRYIVFIGSILSLLCMASAISIFCSFRSIWCDRIVLHLHLMAALTLRYILLYIITEPFIFDRPTNYRDDDWVCKAVLIMYLYATLSSVNWMFIQGIYLNSKLTTNVFDKEPPFKFYYTFGWVVPLPFMGIYGMLMEVNHPVKCWKGYSKMIEIWIVLGPILVDLLVNFGFLINILRILLTKVNMAVPTRHSGEFKHFRRAAKATIILSPILGINNLLFIYNPGGAYHKTFVLLNTFFGATQGVFVTMVYCYLSTDVWDAVKRAYRRFLTRQDANRCRSHQRRAESHNTGISLNGPQPNLHRGIGLVVSTSNNSSSTSNSPTPSPRRVRKLRVYTSQLSKNQNDDPEFSQIVSTKLPENTCVPFAHQHTFISSQRPSIEQNQAAQLGSSQDIPLCHLTPIHDVLDTSLPIRG